MAAGAPPAGNGLGIPAGKKPAIKDVARLAGVAVGTVSNVLNGRPTVTPETRERVLAVIGQLGYVPNATARQLRKGELTTIGAVVLDLANPFFTEMARGIEDRISQDGLVLMLASSDEDADREHRYLDLLLQQGVRGLLVTPSGTDVTHLIEIRDRGTDVVLLDVVSRELDSVGVDDVAGGALAAAHLLDGGRSRLALLNGPHTVRQCAARYAGVARAILTRELDLDATLTEITMQAPLTVDVAETATHELFDRPGPHPDGILCVNDIVALGALQALRARGISVPDDVAVVGYDDVMFAAMLATPLTSVRQPTRQLGWTAADILLQGDSQAGSRHIEFTPELVVRASSSPTASLAQPGLNR
jgi:LacI family transcriptional regulator